MGCNCKLSKHHDDHGVHAGQGSAAASTTVLLVPLASARARHAGDKEEGEETDGDRRGRQHTDSQCCWVALMAGRPAARRTQGSWTGSERESREGGGGGGRQEAGDKVR